MFIGQKVITPYGDGVVSAIPNDNQIIVTPTWTLANNQNPIFYMNKSDVKPFFSIDSEVQTVFGIGNVISIRETDCIYVVHLKTWLLATNQSPVLYLNQASLSKVSIVKHGQETKDDYIPKVDYFETTLNKSKTFKIEATNLFKEQKYELANDKYIESLNLLRYIGDELSNIQKAKVLEQTIPCYNNCALCLFKMQDYPNCGLYAKNAVLLIESLDRHLNGEVLSNLRSLGVTDMDLFQKWKRKGLYYLGRSEMAMHEYEDAIAHLTCSLPLINQSDSKALQETKDLISSATKSLQAQLKKEKSTWSKAFKKNNDEQIKAEQAAAAAAEAEKNKNKNKSTASTKSNHMATSKPKTDKHVSIDLSALKKASKIDEDDSEEDKEDDSTPPSTVSKYASPIIYFTASAALLGLTTMAFMFLRSRVRR